MDVQTVRKCAHICVCKCVPVFVSCLLFSGVHLAEIFSASVYFLLAVVDAMVPRVACTAVNIRREPLMLREE